MDYNLRHKSKDQMKENIFNKANINQKSNNSKNANAIDSEIDFEINNLLKKEIVDLKLEVQSLKKEKQVLENQKLFETKEIMEKKQNLEKINIDINKGTIITLIEFFLQKKQFIQKEEMLKLEKRVLSDRVETLETEVRNFQKERDSGTQI